MASPPPPDPIFILKGAGDPVASLCFIRHDNHNPTMLLAGSETGNIYTWNLKTRRVVSTLQLQSDSSQSVQLIQQLDGDNRLVTQSRDGTINFWDCTGPDWVKTGIVIILIFSCFVIIIIIIIIIIITSSFGL